MSTHDNRLIPVPALDRGLDRSLNDLNQNKGYGVKGYGVVGNEPASLKDYLHIVLKRKWLILSLVLVVTSLVAIQSFRAPSIYEGETTIRIEQKPNILQTDKIVINGQNDPNFWGTQLKLLQNPALARQVVLQLDLPHNPAFFGGGSQSGFFDSLRRIFSSKPKAETENKAATGGLSLVTEPQNNVGRLTPEEIAKLEVYEDAIIAGETIEPIPNTNLVRIIYRHSDPELAQKIANTLAEVFKNYNLAIATEGSNKAEDLLANEIAKLQAQNTQDQEILWNFAKNRNLSLQLGGSQSLETQALATLSAQLLQAENTRKELQAQLEAAKREKDPFSIPDVNASARVDKLRERISALKEQREALLVTYTPEWPGVKKLDMQIKGLEEELTKAPAEIVTSMQRKYEAAVSKEALLRRSYEQQKSETTQQTRDQIDLVAMTQKLETNKQYLNTLRQRQRELQISDGNSGNEVSIATPSRLPKSPVGPQRLRNIIIAFLLSLAGGIGLAFLLDFLDDTVKSVEDVDRYIHLPALALIPSGRDRRIPVLPGATAAPGAANTTALAMITDARSPISESYRHLRTSLLLSSAGKPPKTILITSSQPAEGKTTTGINTAFMLAQTGAEVLMIDCDLRRPRLHAQLELSNAKGLTTWLSGEKNLDGLIQQSAACPNLKILTSGPVPPNPAELLGSEEMRKLLNTLSEKFAHIIIDSPPAISFTDASILSTMVDGVILVVHGGRSSRAVVRRAKQQLLDVGAHIFGVVLNNVKVESHDDYYYSRYYSHYYESDSRADEARGTA
jgi:capsular exopolysaccharide synthesis family protein